MNIRDKLNACTQDKITDYFELSQNKNMNKLKENTHDLSLSESIVKHRLNRKKINTVNSVN